MKYACMMKIKEKNNKQTLLNKNGMIFEVGI